LPQSLDYWNPEKNKKLKTTSIFNNPQVQMDRLIQAEMGSLSPTQYQTFNAFMSRYPNQSKDFIMSAVRMGLSPDTPGIGKLASIDGLAQLKQDLTNQKNIKSSVEKDKTILGDIRDGLYAVTKGTTRVGFAATRSIYDSLTTLGRNAYAISTGEKAPDFNQVLKDVGQGIFGESTQLGQLGRAFLANPTKVDTGSGFFISDDSKVSKAQAKAMAAYGQINGKSFTLGRGLMTTVGADPNSTTYRVMSGIVDATINIGTDPLTFLGPGALTKIGRGGKELKGAKAAAQREQQRIAAEFKERTGLTKDEKALLKERTAGAKEILRQAEDKYLKADEKLAKAADARNSAEVSKAQKRLTAGVKNEQNLVSAEGKSVTEQAVAEFVYNAMNTGKQADVIDGLSRISADYFNTGEGFTAAVFFDDIPKAGELTFAARGNDEFVAQFLPGKKKPVVVDMAADFSQVTGKAADVEIANRVALRDSLLEKANDFSLPGPTRDAFTRIADDIDESMRLIDSVLGGAPESLGSFVGKIAAAKVPQATEIIIDSIQDIWKADMFTNIRSIYGGNGGVAITNGDYVAARGVKASEVLADSAQNGANAALGLSKAMQKSDATMRKLQKAVDDAQKNLEDTKVRLGDITKLRTFVQRDPDLVKQMINDPDNAGLKNIMDLELQIGEARFADEWTRAEVGLVDSFGGGISADGTKAMKYLFGRKFQAIAEIVAGETNAMRVHRLFGRKLDVDLTRELADATTSDQVISIFLRHLASPETDPIIARSMLLRTELALGSKSPVIKVTDKINIDAVKWVEKAEKAFSNIYVRSTVLPLGDLDRLVPGLNDWFTTAKVPQNVVDDILNKVIRESDYTSRSKIIMDGMKVAQSSLVDAYGKGDPELAKVLDQVLKVAGKEQAIVKQYNVAKLATGTTPTMMLHDGSLLPMTGANYAHQFLDDVIQLRDTKPIVQAINKYNRNSQLFGKARAAKVAADEIGDYWRTAQLAFRVSYTMRNIGEMQLRQFFSGHDSIFKNPLSYIAMAMANPQGGSMQKLASQYAKYQNDIFGTSFKDPKADALFTEAVDEYLQFVNRSISAGDPRTAFVGKIYEVVDNMHPDYYSALSVSLMRFASDDLMPLVARARTPELQESTLKYLTEDKAGLEILQKIQKGARLSKDEGRGVTSDFDVILLKDVSKPFSKDNINVDNLRNYLFDDQSTASYMYALNALTGAGAKSDFIRSLLAGERVVFGSGDNAIAMSIPSYKRIENINDMKTLDTPFKNQLERFFPREEMTNGSALLASSKRFADADEKQLTKAVDWFFDLNTRLENVVNFGPEYRMAYWDHVGRYATMLDTDDLKKALKFAHQSLDGMKVGGKALKKHPTIKFIEKELGRRGDNYVHEAGISLQQLNSMSAKSASAYTKGLFYDASQQLQSAQALRLAFPFIQAQFNTIRKWGELFVKNPANFYKLGRAYNALTKEGTSAIYDITGVEYDEGQGFIYEDEFGEKRFRYPIAGSFIGGLAGQLIGVENGALSKLEITAPVQSLNLAFGSVNPGVPGFGPAAQFAFQATGKSAAFGPVWETIRTVVMPFGESQDAIGGLAPAWLRKTFYYAINDQKMVERGIKDWASYLASTGKYGDNPLADDTARNQLFDDAAKMSRGVGLLQALFQNIAPATPSAEIFAKIPTNKGKLDFASLTMLYSMWDQISQKHPGEYMKAVTEFADEFGENNLLAIMGGSSRSVTGTADAWTFLQQNPDVADQYATKSGDIIPFFFPGGEAATSYYSWQRATGRREALSREEIAGAAEELIYKMAKSQISDMQAAGGYSDVWYAQEINALNQRFGGAAPASLVTVGTDQERIANVSKALADERFQDSPIYNETLQFYRAYSEAVELLKTARVTADPDLGSSHWYATSLRTNLEALGNQLVLQNPAFAPMYYRVFAGTMKAKD
jgi:hypothetical protein